MKKVTVQQVKDSKQIYNNVTNLKADLMEKQILKKLKT